MGAAAAQRDVVADVQRVRVADIWPNPDQPRQEFDPAHIADLWASIAEKGLLQPISLTDRVGPNGQPLMVVAGECRWRAHVHGNAEFIDAIIRPGLDDQTIMVLAILENARRRDVQPLEEAVAFQKCLDRGMTIEELAKQIGVQQPWRITERTCLLNLRPEYQTLLRGKQIGASQAYEMAQLPPAGQDQLFKLIRAGECPDYATLRAQAAAVKCALEQQDFFGELDDKPTEAEKRLAKGLESRFGQVIRCLRASTVDNEVVAVRKVSPDRAGSLADLAHEMQRELARIEKALRSGAPQLELAAND